MSTQIAIIDESQLPPEDEVGAVLDYLFSHRKASIQDFLQANELARSGTKQELRERIMEALVDEIITVGDLIVLLDTIEGWGNQHVYLYTAPAGELKRWKTEAGAKKCLRKINAEKLLNGCRPLLLPDEPTLSSVEWDGERVRFIWVEKREWTKRRSDLDEPASEDGIVYKAYEETLARGVTSLDVDLSTGHAALMIQSLPTGEGYDEIRREYEDAIEDAMNVGNFTRTEIVRAIKKLEKSNEVSNRQIAHETAAGSRARFTSKSRKADAYDDVALKKSRDALGPTGAVLGNFYWQEAVPALARTIHTKLFAADKRVSIHGECTEEEVKYVLSRVRYHSR